MSTFFIGLSLGFAYVAPIGLQNLFVINSALTEKRIRAYMTALIVIFFDISLALACFFGIGVLMDKVSWLKLIVLLVGSLIVGYIGIGLIKSKSTLDRSVDMHMKWSKLIMSAFTVTWLNPQALIDGTMMIGAFKATLPPDQGVYFIAGMMIASSLWFLGITTVIQLFSNKITDRVLNIINKVCGGIILIYAIKLLIDFISLIK